MTVIYTYNDTITIDIDCQEFSSNETRFDQYKNLLINLNVSLLEYKKSTSKCISKRILHSINNCRIGVQFVQSCQSNMYIGN